jgi:hypothetical protein
MGVRQLFSIVNFPFNITLIYKFSANPTQIAFEFAQGVNETGLF